MNPDMHPEGLRLYAGCLTSKHGFDDGGIPAEVAERFQPNMWDDAWYKNARDVWQHVLTGMVKELLVPALGVDVVFPTLWLNHSMHNPCEAESIGGVPLKDPDGLRASQDRDWYSELRPEYVDVPWPEVGRRLQAAMDYPTVGYRAELELNEAEGTR